MKTLTVSNEGNSFKIYLEDKFIQNGIKKETPTIDRRLNVK